MKGYVEVDAGTATNAGAALVADADVQAARLESEKRAQIRQIEDRLVREWNSRGPLWQVFHPRAQPPSWSDAVELWCEENSWRNMLASTERAVRRSQIDRQRCAGTLLLDLCFSAPHSPRNTILIDGHLAAYFTRGHRLFLEFKNAK